MHRENLGPRGAKFAETLDLLCLFSSSVTGNAARLVFASEVWRSTLGQNDDHRDKKSQT